MQNRNPQWAKKIKKRDEYTCCRCGFNSSDHRLQAHHIMPVKTFRQYTNSDFNGLTLCRSCHNKITNKELRTNLLEFINEHPYSPQQAKPNRRTTLLASLERHGGFTDNESS